MIKVTFASLILLTIFTFYYLSWLVFKTIKEGKKALEEIRKDKE